MFWDDNIPVCLPLISLLNGCYPPFVRLVGGNKNDGKNKDAIIIINGALRIKRVTTRIDGIYWWLSKRYETDKCKNYCQ